MEGLEVLEGLEGFGKLERLEGSIQAIEYCAFGKLPGDGNHNGMKDHKPVKHSNLDALD